MLAATTTAAADPFPPATATFRIAMVDMVTREWKQAEDEDEDEDQILPPASIRCDSLEYIHLITICFKSLTRTHSSKGRRVGI